MAASTRRDLTEPFAHPLFGGEVMELKLAPGTKTGYKGVSKGYKNTYQARATIDGKLRHVWTCSDPQECAFILARFEQYPCLLQSQRKERGEWTGRMTDAEAAESGRRESPRSNAGACSGRTGVGAPQSGQRGSEARPRAYRGAGSDLCTFCAAGSAQSGEK